MEGICNVCNGVVEELSGFCDCTQLVKYEIECFECGCIFEETDYINNPTEKIIYGQGQCNDCFENEVEYLK